MNDEGPFTEEANRNPAKAIKRKIITYEEVNAGVKITTVSRRYYESGDYHDDMSTEILPLNK